MDNTSTGPITFVETDGAEENRRSSITRLPPADGGKDAWLFLAGAFMLEALVWGLSIILFVLS